MNQVSRDEKDQVLKSMAIIGFIAVIIFGVWLAVKIVGLMPSAFSSLASIADGVYNYRPAETSETVEIGGSDAPGSYEDDVILLTTDSFPEETVSDTTASEETADVTSEVATEPEVETVAETPTTPATPAPPSTPAVVETVTYEIPTSNPAGFTDLAIRLLGVGELDSTGNFVKGSGMYGDERGAFQFEVKNIGTKTSSDWDFTATLTNGITYDAPKQTPLKPQERAIFTLGYDNTGDDGIQNIGVDLNVSDTNNANNSFAWAVVVN